MEMTVTTQEGRLVVNNKAEFQRQITAITAHYSGLAVTDKAEAKRDRASVNRLLRAIDDKRKEAKRQYEAPFKAFEAELKELTEPLKAAGAAIDAQIKAIEDKERAERVAWVREEFDKLPQSTVAFEDVYDSSWELLSKSKAAILSELHAAVIAAQAVPKTAAPIHDVQTNAVGVPVFTFENKKARAITFFCTTSEFTLITQFADKLGVAYMEG